VLDDAEHVGSQYALGRQTVTAESANVRHAGSAMVVFDDRRVVPLFEASCVEAAMLPLKRTPDFNWSRHWTVVQRVCGSIQAMQKMRRRGSHRLVQRHVRLKTPGAFLGRRGAQKRR
jgi:hypothetical protein